MIHAHDQQAALIARLRAQVADRDVQIARLRAQVAGRDAQVADRDAQIAQLLARTSDSSPPPTSNS